MNRRRGAGYTLLTLLIGAALFMIDVLPLLLWMGFHLFAGITTVTESNRATVVGSFVVALLLCPLWAIAVHRGLRSLLRARTPETTPAPAANTSGATESVKPKATQQWGTVRPRQVG
jgi:hypothetical protein